MDDQNQTSVQPTVPAVDPNAPVVPPAPVGDQGGQPAWTPPAETPAVDPNAPVVPPAEPVQAPAEPAMPEPAPVAQTPVVEQPAA